MGLFASTPPSGEYIPISGTLTWQPGDTTPKVITVAVNPSE